MGYKKNRLRLSVERYNLIRDKISIALFL